MYFKLFCDTAISHDQDLEAIISSQLVAETSFWSYNLEIKEGKIRGGPKKERGICVPYLSELVGDLCLINATT